MNLEFFVSGGRLTYKGPSTPVSGCGDTFTITFDEPWKELVKVVTLRNGADAVQVLYTGKTSLPRQVCGRGELHLCCYGYGQMGDEVAVLKTRPMVRPVRLLGAQSAGMENTAPELPSLYEQVMAAVGAAKTAAAEAEDAIGKLKKLREDGAFRGEQGLPGQAATVTVEQVRHGQVAAVENLGTDRNAILRFTLPYKLTEEEKTQVLGDLEAVIDHILQLQQQLLGGDGT